MAIIQPLKTLTIDSISKTRREPTAVPSLNNATAFRALAKRAGFFPRRRAERAAGLEAAEHFSALSVLSIRAEARIATASLQTAVTQIMTHLIATTTTAIGAELLDLDARTSAVQQRLTTASSGELVAQLNNRKATANALRAMIDDGDVAAEESAALVASLYSDTTDDIERSRRRTSRSKDVIERLHDLALDGAVGPSNDTA